MDMDIGYCIVKDLTGQVIIHILDEFLLEVESILVIFLYVLVMKREISIEVSRSHICTRVNINSRPPSDITHLSISEVSNELPHRSALDRDRN